MTHIVVGAEVVVVVIAAMTREVAPMQAHCESTAGNIVQPSRILCICSTCSRITLLKLCTYSMALNNFRSNLCSGMIMIHNLRMIGLSSLKNSENKIFCRLLRFCSIEPYYLTIVS